MSACAWVNSSLQNATVRHMWRFSITTNETGSTGDRILSAELYPNSLNIVSSLDSDPTF